MTPARAIFVFTADNDLLIFTGLDEASSWMEAVDVDDGEYPAIYTDEGSVVKASLNSETVVLADSGRRDLDDLSNRLARYAEMVDLPAPTDRLAFANTMLKREWDRQRSRRPRWLFKRIYGETPPFV
ncbi:hypothetical protein [Terrabacter sp. MAHUQ-38]|uniref:hypothetical protein n=1 Tax=unclassified Terrabacter TaxID=2630222 RepID=UPI00165DBB55|nr:hypothetical protein [Terrabacter sp. MAHUQ-38]MBC9819701.1 hypothetical protein [Terrabacter sp. MAHUQ-38]